MTIGNVRMITPNEGDAATLTANPVLVATLPVENLQEQSRGRVARSTGLAAPQHFLGTWVGLRALGGFALVRHNLTSAATVRLKIYEGVNQTGTLLYDSGDVFLGDNIPAWGDDPWGQFQWGGSVFGDWPVAYINFWFDQIMGQSFDFTCVDAGNTDGYYEASRLFIGPVFEPLQNVDYGISCGWQDDSTQVPTAGGGLRTHAVEPYRVWQFNWSYLSEGERASLNEYARNYGKRGDTFISCYPGAGGARERDHAGAVKMVESPLPVHPFVNHYFAPISLREI